MAAPTDGTGTTISKYIARFRQEKPRPREARKDARREDFWWVRSRPEREGATMDWELELLSETSAESEGYAGTQRSIAGGEDAALSPSWSLPSFLDVESPVASKSTIPASPVPSVEGARRSTSGTSPSLSAEREVFDYEDFVVLSDHHPAQQAGRFEDLSLEPRDENDKALMEASMEDPEMVIQRIRRRLGYQQMPSPLPPLYLSSFSEHRGDEHEATNNILQEKEDDSLSLLHQEPESAISEASEHERPPPLISSPLNSEASLDDSVEPQMSDCSDEPHSKELITAESEPKTGADETDSKVDKSTTVDPCVMKFPELEMKHTTLHSGGDERDVQDVSDVESSASFDDWKLDGCESSVPSDGQELAPAESRSKSIPPVSEGDSRDKRSPRLPPLSPARSPHFRLATPPRSTQKTFDPEIPVETSKTLDHLLSFVVHSWGENSLSSEDTKDEHEPLVTSKPTDNESSCVMSDKPKDSERDHQDVDSPGEVDNADECGVGDNETAFDKDPIVAVLRNRIAVFEEALHRLDNAHSTT